MKLYAMIDYVVSLLYNPILGKDVGPNAAEDAKQLSEMCSDVRRTTAMNGRKYWYLFLRDGRFTDVALYLFARNGLEPQFHRSRYNGSKAKRVPVLRIETQYLEKYPQFNDFVNLISAQDYTDTRTFEAHMEKIREKMSARSR